MSVSWHVPSLGCHNNNVGDTWWCLESPGTAESAPDRHTPVSGSLGNTVFMTPASRVTLFYTDWWVSDWALSGGCLQCLSCYDCRATAAVGDHCSSPPAERLQGPGLMRHPGSTGPRTPGQGITASEKWESELQAAARQSSPRVTGVAESAAITFWHTLTFNAPQFLWQWWEYICSRTTDICWLLPEVQNQGGCDRRERFSRNH